MNLTEKIANFLVETSLDKMPQEVVSRAKEMTLDTIGVGLAGSVQPAGEIVADFVRNLGGNPQATVIGKNFKTSAPSAALANGTSCAELDYDNSSFFMIGHPSGSIVPSVIAFGEEIGASGRDVLEAHILGFETGMKLAKGFLIKVDNGFLPGQYLRGWHSTGTLGIIMCAAACAKLARLGLQEAVRAFGIAASLAGALRGNFGSMTKPFHSGAAAMQGIIAVSLAKRGLTASDNIFEHDYGYCALTVGKDNFQPKAIEEALESGTYSVIDPGIGVKIHCCNTAAFGAIDCIIELVKEYDIKPDQVESIKCGFTPVAMDIADRIKAPRTGHEGKYSLTYPIAISAVDREAGINQFTDERVLDPVVRDLVAKVKTYVHPELTNLDVHDTAACHLTIKLKDGREFNKYRARPIGYPGGDPIGRAELLDKYRKCAGLVLPADNIDQSIELLDRLEEVPDIREVTRLLSPA